MYTRNNLDGFSKVKLVVFLLIIAVLITGGYFGFRWYTQQQATSQAVAFSDSFVVNIQNNDYVKSYQQLTSTAQGSVGGIGWEVWVADFKTNNVTFNKPPIGVQQVITASIPTYLLTYTLSTRLKFQVTVVKSKSSYLVSNYGVES